MFLNKLLLSNSFRDHVFSQSFQDIIIRSRKEKIPYYKQFVIEDEAFKESRRTTLSLNNEVLKSMRCKEIEKFFSRPSTIFLSTVFKILIFDAIHQKFQIGPAFPKQLTDKNVNEEVSRLLCPTYTCKPQK